MVDLDSSASHHQSPAYWRWWSSHWGVTEITGSMDGRRCHHGGCSGNHGQEECWCWLNEWLNGCVVCWCCWAHCSTILILPCGNILFQIQTGFFILNNQLVHLIPLSFLVIPLCFDTILMHYVLWNSPLNILIAHLYPNWAHRVLLIRGQTTINRSVMRSLSCPPPTIYNLQPPTTQI